MTHESLVLLKNDNIVHPSDETPALPLSKTLKKVG